MPALIISDPDILKEIMVKQFSKFTDRVVSIDKYKDDSVFKSYTEIAGLRDARNLRLCFLQRTGPGCSKLTTSLDNVSLKF